jgi:hypothetical protein
LKRIILRSIPAFFLELKPGIVTIGLLNGPLTITTTITQFAIRFSFVRGVCSSRQNTVSCANWDRVRVAACDVMKRRPLAATTILFDLSAPISVMGEPG